MPSLSSSFRDVFAFRFSCLIAYHTAPRATVSQIKKLFADQHATVLTDSESDVLKMEGGTKQVDLLSSLFISHAAPSSTGG